MSRVILRTDINSDSSDDALRMPRICEFVTGQVDDGLGEMQYDKRTSPKAGVA